MNFNEDNFNEENFGIRPKRKWLKIIMIIVIVVIVAFGFKYSINIYQELMKFFENNLK